MMFAMCLCLKLNVQKEVYTVSAHTAEMQQYFLLKTASSEHLFLYEDK